MEEEIMLFTQSDIGPSFFTSGEKAIGRKWMVFIKLNLDGSSSRKLDRRYNQVYGIDCC